MFLYHNIKDNERNLCQDFTDSDLKLHALHYANVLYSSDFVREKNNDDYSMSIRVQTMTPHFDLFFNTILINVKENILRERELKKALRDTLTQAAWYGLLSTMGANQIARLAAVVVKWIFSGTAHCMYDGSVGLLLSALQ